MGRAHPNPESLLQSFVFPTGEGQSLLFQYIFSQFYSFTYAYQPGLNSSACSPTE